MMEIISFDMWGAGFVVAAVQAVTSDKKPVTDLFLCGSGYLGDAPTPRGLWLEPFRGIVTKDEPRAAIVSRHNFARVELSGFAPERISHDKNEMRYRHTCRSRIGGSAACRKCPIVGGLTKQHAPEPRRTGTTRHIWKFGADRWHGHRAVDRNIQPAFRWRDQFSPQLEQYQPSNQAIVAI
jgi:hypothetical protein